MNGKMTFEEALATRMSLINPSLSQLEAFIHNHPPRLTPGIKELVQNLQSHNIQVFLVSGGFRQMIEPVAEAIGVPKENIYSNLLLFAENGEYKDFDRSQPTCTSAGKAVAVQLVKER
eukprot:c8507_g1_i1.p1 GENE.c8507_g1_i1~~c8507_g1_i1.p1  ORF type:complete len:118 (+),score=34.10 c8507_g1_i1:290-643(+)